jgi:hypothetical protein
MLQGFSFAQPSGESTVVFTEVDALRHAGGAVAQVAAHTDGIGSETFPTLRSWSHEWI